MVKKSQIEISTPKARGKRLKMIRHFTGLSQPDFANQYGLAEGTVKNWEAGRYSGISLESIERIVEIAYQVGIEDCKPEWLLYGSNPPTAFRRALVSTGMEIADSALTSQEDSVIQQELMQYHQQYQDAMDYIVSDDCMIPAYQVGDHVAGRRLFGREIDKAVGKDCIIQIDRGETVVRNLMAGDKAGFYTLIAYNVSAKTNSPHYQDVKLFCVAPIDWIRRKITFESLF